MKGARCACGALACADPTGTFGADFADRLCARCWRRRWREFAQMRRAYQELVAAGVHPKMASRRVLVKCRL